MLLCKSDALFENDTIRQHNVRYLVVEKCVGDLGKSDAGMKCLSIAALARCFHAYPTSLVNDLVHE